MFERDHFDNGIRSGSIQQQLAMDSSICTPLGLDQRLRLLRLLTMSLPAVLVPDKKQIDRLTDRHEQEEKGKKM